jgi:hypothetical protein
VMKGEIRIAFAEKDGHLLHISEVAAGLTEGCRCPVCGTAAVARKGQIKRHHFAHYPGANCSAESVLHEVGKRLLCDSLAAAIKRSTPIHLEWDCDGCNRPHAMDLLDGARSVEMEHAVGPCRPDVVLLGLDGSPTACLEVVVTHAPEDHVIAHCRLHSMPLLIFKVKNAAALERLRQLGPARPDVLHHCLSARCDVCQSPLSDKSLSVVIGPCYRCGAPMQVALMDAEGYRLGPEDFTPSEIATATSMGAFLREHNGYMRGASCLANTCRSCGAISGTGFAHHYQHLIAPGTSVTTGKYCGRCAKHFGT